MKLLNLLLASLVLPAPAAARDPLSVSYQSSKANKRKRSKGSKKGHESQHLTLNIVNEAFNQPFSPFFVMVHNSDAEPLYVRGSPASEPLALLAENGSPAKLVEYYTMNTNGVKSADAFVENPPFFLGDKVEIEVEVSDEYPLVTIASMAINTNDCFVSLNGVKVYEGQTIDVPGLDAGSEENNESCDSIPGPGCPMDSGNEMSGNGEGYVHIHRGFFGIGDLAEDRYDWRNPMMRVVVS